MKKLLVVVALVGFTGFAAEESKDHTAKQAENTKIASEAVKNAAPQGLTEDKLAKLNQFVQACSVNRPSAIDQLGNIPKY